MSELANQFIQNKTVSEIHLVLLAKSDDFYKVDAKVSIHRLGFENRGRVGKFLSELRTLLRLRKLFKNHRPDAILCFMEKYNAFTIIASGFLGLKVYVSDRSNPLKKIHFQTEWLRKLTYKHSTGIIAQTQFAKEVLYEKTKHKNIKVIPNPVKKIQSFPLVKKDKIILNVGRLVPEKGQKYAIEAFAKLTIPEWKLVILGEGPIRSELEALIRELGVEKQVVLKGAVHNVDEWLAKASLFVFPSISEGFPNALVEAMAAGLPCISFDCNAGPRDIVVHEKNGILIGLKEVNDLSSFLFELIDNENKRIGLGREATQIKFELDIEIIASSYLEFLTMTR
jgi:glycosyltransferase involved in cell wall biosynthesis